MRTIPGLSVLLALLLCGCARDWQPPVVEPPRSFEASYAAGELWPGAPATEVWVTGDVGRIVVTEKGTGVARRGFNPVPTLVSLLAHLSGVDVTRPASADALFSTSGPLSGVSLEGVAWSMEVKEDQGRRGIVTLSEVRLDPLPPQRPEHNSGDPSQPLNRPVDTVDERVHRARAGCVEHEWRTGRTPQRVARWYDDTGAEPVVEGSSTEAVVLRSFEVSGDQVTAKVEDGRRGRTIVSSLSERTVHLPDGSTVVWENDRWVALETRTGRVERTTRVDADGTPRWIGLEGPMMGIWRTNGPEGRARATGTWNAGGVTDAWHQWRCGEHAWDDVREVDSRTVGYTVADTRWPGNGADPSQSAPVAPPCFAGFGVETLDRRARVVAADACAPEIQEWAKTAEMPRTWGVAWWRVHVANGRATALHRQSFISEEPGLTVEPLVLPGLEAGAVCRFTPVLDGNRVAMLHAPGDCPTELVAAAAETWIGRDWPARDVAGTPIPLLPVAFDQAFIVDGGTASVRFGHRPGALPAYDVEEPLNRHDALPCDVAFVVDEAGWPISVTSHCIPEHVELASFIVGDRVLEAASVDWWERVGEWRFQATGQVRRVVVPTVLSRSATHGSMLGEPIKLPLPTRSPAVPVPLKESSVVLPVGDASGIKKLRLAEVHLLEGEVIDAHITPMAEGWKLIANANTPWPEAQQALASLTGPLAIAVEGGAQRQIPAVLTPEHAWIPHPPDRWSPRELTDLTGGRTAIVELAGGATLQEAVAAQSALVVRSLDGFGLHRGHLGPAQERGSAVLSDLVPVHMPKPDLGALVAPAGADAVCEVSIRLFEGVPSFERRDVDCDHPYRPATQALMHRWRFEVTEEQPSSLRVKGTVDWSQ